MGIKQTSETFVSPENHSWLRVAMGLNEADPATLDGDAFLAAGAILASYANGDIPSGVPVAKLAATGRLVPYVDGVAVDGSATCVGLLAHTKSIGKLAGSREPCAVFWGPGEVILSKLPVALDAAGQADLPHIKFVA